MSGQRPPATRSYQPPDTRASTALNEIRSTPLLTVPADAEAAKKAKEQQEAFELEKKKEAYNKLARDEARNDMAKSNTAQGRGGDHSAPY